jgi:hypothetical protein
VVQNSGKTPRHLHTRFSTVQDNAVYPLLSELAKAEQVDVIGRFRDLYPGIYSASSKATNSPQQGATFGIGLDDVDTSPIQNTLIKRLIRSFRVAEQNLVKGCSAPS